MNNIINLVSDTITRPTPAMLQAMMNAQVGDDVFGEDPTVRALEEKAAAMFGKAAAVFCPSGTMTNQIALKAHTHDLEEVICDKNSHIYLYETGGYAHNGRLAVKLLEGTNGKITAEQVANAINPLYDWFPKSSLVVLENTCNRGGGSIYTLDEITPIQQVCQEHDLKLHLDGARIFNALVETGETPLQYGQVFDSISICLSKGLGAPVGSLLLGEANFIKQARRLRKVMGGGMRQAGYLAAAGIYALDNHIERLRDDNQRAKKLGNLLATLPSIAQVRPVESNIVIFDVKAPWTGSSFVAALGAKGIKASSFGQHTVRLVTHLDVSEAMVSRAMEILQEVGGK